MFCFDSNLIFFNFVVMSLKQIEIEDRVCGILDKYGVESILLGISGGADSVGLLRLLLGANLSRRRVVGVHCNFRLRGEESERDEMFVKGLCEELGVELHVLTFDVDSYRREHGGSIEMACRELRYDAFRRMRRELGLDRIAVAHNLNDNVETFMLNLMRGGGLKGLKGMDEDNGEIIRPLLQVSRREIENYLASQNQTYIVDSSNLSDDYNRNFLRNKVLPLLESRWQGAMRSIAKSQNVLRDEYHLSEHYLHCELTDSQMFLPRSADGLKVSARSLIFRFIEPFGGSVSIAGEIAAVVDKGFEPRSWILSDRYVIEEERGGWRITDVSEGGLPEPEWEWIEHEVTSELMSDIRKDRSNNVLWTTAGVGDYDFRHPLPGDRMSMLGRRGTSLLSDIFKDRGLTLRQRSEVWVAVRKNTGEIVWCEGVKRSAIDIIGTEDSVVRSVRRRDNVCKK